MGDERPMMVSPEGKEHPEVVEGDESMTCEQYGCRSKDEVRSGRGSDAAGGDAQ